MLHRGALYLLILALALLASPGLAPPPVAAQATLVVDDDGSPCLQTPIVFSTIQAALGAANPGDTIRVCEGDYWETQILAASDYVTITGPGATPENDGVATVHLSMFAVLFHIHADYVLLQGLVLDAAPPIPGATTIAIVVDGNSVSIEHNEIRNATGTAVEAYSGSRYVQILSNNIHDSHEGVRCQADDCVVAGNTVNVTDFAVDIVGDGGNVTNNTIVHGRVNASGDDSFISTNQITGPASGPLLRVSGSRVGVTDNTLSGTTGYGIQALIYQGSESMDVTILRNTFTDIRTPIYLSDWDPNDPFTLTAGIGGSASDANTFVDSGGSLGDGDQLLSLVNVTMDVNAQYNNWGLCSLAEIEQEIFHQVDDPTLGLVDFDPFIAPGSCSATPTPTPTATPTATATATPTPPVGLTRTVVWSPGWHNETWSGASTPEEVFACAAGNFAAAYRLVSGGWERHFPNRLDISNMQDIEQYDAFFILVTQDTTCQMPLADPPGALRTLGWGVGWNNDGWTGPDGTSPQDAFACAGGNYAAVYRLVSGGWERYFPDRPDISNMGPLNKYDAFLILVTAPVSCTMAVAL